MRMSQSLLAIDLKRAAESGIVGTNAGKDKGGLATEGNALPVKAGALRHVRYRLSRRINLTRASRKQYGQSRSCFCEHATVDELNDRR